jgi:DNA replication regulator DPB11
MRYAEKFNGTGEANVHLVWEEWFWDSLEFGGELIYLNSGLEIACVSITAGRFDEAKYQVRRPRPERKSILERPYATINVSRLKTAEVTKISAHRRQFPTTILSCTIRRRQ